MRAHPGGIRRAALAAAALLACAGGAAHAANPTLAVAIDFTQDRHAIGPDIYGVNFGSDASMAALRYPVRRYGGNATTRYNWQADVHNTASDWYYENIPDAALDPLQLPSGSSADQFVAQTASNGGAALITVNTLGYVPLDQRVGSVPKLRGYSILKYGPQDSNECATCNGDVGCLSWCSADAGNGTCANVANVTGHCVAGKIVGNNPLDTSKAVGPSYAAQWIAHLQGAFGPAASGGVRYYALDNEPMLWNSTHRDVHPNAPDYAEVWTRGRDAAAAIKAQDPGAQVMGPVTWGWCDLFTSAKDVAANGPGGSCLTGPDRTAHGGTPFIRWYMQQVCADAATRGKRLVDYVDLHYYPQAAGVDGLSNDLSSENATTSALRLRSLKELYDPAYVSESWIGDAPYLIPRLKAWIAQDCPGLKLALTEYKWGPDDGASGALAQAEALAIFGREGLDLATRWVAPVDGSKSIEAFRMFLDHDGNHTRLVGDSVRATSTNKDEVGAYAIDRGATAVYVLLFNKATGARDVQLSFGTTLSGGWKRYYFDATHDLTQSQTGSIAGSTLTLTGLPARSATLLVLPALGGGGGGGGANVIFANHFESP